MHYTLNSTFEQIIKDLPQDAQKDFQDTIVDYRKYAEVLKKLKLYVCRIDL